MQRMDRRRAAADGWTDAAPATVSIASRTVGRRRLEAVIRVDGLGVAYGSRTVVDDVDLEVRRGEVVGLIGANGAGKSTLMNAIGGFVRSQGTIEMLGHDATRLSPARRAPGSASAARSRAPSCSRTSPCARPCSSRSNP